MAATLVSNPLHEITSDQPVPTIVNSEPTKNMYNAARKRAAINRARNARTMRYNTRDNYVNRYAAYSNPLNNMGRPIETNLNIREMRNNTRYNTAQLFPRRNYNNSEFDHMANTESNYEGNENRTRIRDPSEKLNFIKRIWMVAKDVTHKYNYDDVIERYQRILKVDPDNVKNSELNLFVAARKSSRTWKNRLNPFTTFHRFTTPNLVIHNTTSNENRRTIKANRKRIRADITSAAIKAYQINAYNELIGIMLVLMEKARDKYTEETLASRLGLRKSVFSSEDKEGIMHIDNLQEDYVLGIFGYNLDDRLEDMYQRFKKHNPSNPTSLVAFIKKYPAVIPAIGSLVYIITMASLFGSVNNSNYMCPPDTTVITQGYRSKTVYCKAVNGTLTLAPYVKSMTQAVLTVGTMTAEQILSISLAHGIPTAAILSYKMYKMYRGYKRKMLLKDIFVNIHKVIFNEDNYMQYNDAKDELFVYTDILSDAEQELFDEYGPYIDSEASDNAMYEYLTEFLKARTVNLLKKGEETLIEFIKRHPKTQEDRPVRYGSSGNSTPYFTMDILRLLFFS
jgi:hypothetical protein